jgi:hypothetical protein
VVGDVAMNFVEVGGLRLTDPEELDGGGEASGSILKCAISLFPALEVVAHGLEGCLDESVVAVVGVLVLMIENFLRDFFPDVLGLGQLTVDVGALVVFGSVYWDEEEDEGDVVGVEVVSVVGA